MSRSVRIRGDIAAQVQVLADRERRPFANAVEVLLLAALTERDDGRLKRTAGVDLPVAASRSVSPADVAATVPGVGIVRPHMKKNRPAVECPTRWPSGVCPDCGQTV